MRDRSERVVLVNERDAETGTLGKLRAHREGRLHRAFSVFVVNSRGEMLLQRRAAGKYHSGGLWSNACCGHPRPGEATEAAARRRLREEMGFGCDLSRVFGFVYRVELEEGMREHEYDHVFLGRWDGEPRPDPEEVEGWRWEEPGTVLRELERDREAYTHWFGIALEGLAARGALRSPPRGYRA